jgi:hypothetical protein
LVEVVFLSDMTVYFNVLTPKYKMLFGVSTNIPFSTEAAHPVKRVYDRQKKILPAPGDLERSAAAGC